MIKFLLDIVLFFPRLIFKSVAYMISFVIGILILLFALGYCAKSAIIGNSTTEHRVIEHHIEHKNSE